MNIKLNDVLKFAAGAVIGSAVTWVILDKKYKRIAQEEIDAMSEYYRKKKETEDEEAEDKENYIESESERCEELREGVLMGGAIDIPVPQEYKDLASRYTGTEVDKMEDRPYVIPPEAYGELDGYKCISLSYYSDGVVADDFDEIIEDVDDIIGVESLTHFGEYEDDSVFVRNDRLRCDYEILRDTRKFTELTDESEDN